MPEPSRDQNLSLDSVVVASQEQVSSDLGNEVVILHLPNGVYYGLDPIGTHIWGHLREPRTVRSLRDSVLHEYDVEPERCERELLALLRDLIAAGLVKVTGTGPA